MSPLERLRFFSRPARLRFVHMVKNPPDPIGSMDKRGPRSVEEACSDYASQSARRERIRPCLAAEVMLTVQDEHLLSPPEDTITPVVLGLIPEPGQLAACAGLSERDRRCERTRAWSPSLLVCGVIESHSFLASYRDAIQTGSVGR